MNEFSAKVLSNISCLSRDFALIQRELMPMRGGGGTTPRGIGGMENDVTEQ